MSGPFTNMARGGFARPPRAMSSNVGMGRGFAGTFQRNIGKAQRYIGQKEVNVNEMGGYALGAMGMMAAANIGSSIISSNKGY